MHQAVRYNHADVVRVLVEGGANVNVEDERLITPLLLAGSAVNCDDLNEMTKFVEIVRILVAAKVFVDFIHPDTGISQSIERYVIPIEQRLCHRSDLWFITLLQICYCQENS